MTDARIGVTVDIPDAAIQKVKALGDAILSMNGGGSQTSTPSIAPPNAPRLTNGLGSYDSGYVSPTQAGWAGWTPQGGYNDPLLSGVLNPPGNANVGRNRVLSPGALAPSPFGMGGWYGGGGPGGPPVFPSAPNGFGGGGSGIFGSGTGGPVPVNVVGSIDLRVHIINGAGGGSGTGAGSGGSGGSGSGGGAGGSGGGAPMRLDDFPGRNQRPGFDQFIKQVKQNPTLGGVADAALDIIPAGPAAIYGGVVAAANYGLGIYSANTAHQYATDTTLEAAGIRGTFVDSYRRQAMQQNARLEDVKGVSHAWLALPDLVSGGAFSKAYDLGYGRKIDRGIADNDAAAETAAKIARLNRLTGASGSIDATGIDAKTQLSNLALRGGTGTLKGLRDWDMRPYLNGADGTTPDDLTGGVGAIWQTASQARYGNLFDKYTSGQAISAKEVLPAYIASGNADGVISLFNMNALSLGEFKAAMAQVNQTQRLGVQAQVAQSGVGMAGSAVSLAQATGAGYRQVSSLIQGQARSLAPGRAVLVQQLARAQAAGDVVAVAGLQAQLADNDAQSAGLSRSSVMNTFAGRGVDIQSDVMGASNQMYRAQYGGTQTQVLSAFEGRRRAENEQVRLDFDQSNAVGSISPEERRRLRRRAEQERLAATTGIDREESAYSYSVDTSRLGLKSSYAQTVATNASLFGGPGEIYAGAQGQAAVMAQNIARDRQRLNDPKSHLTQEEQITLQTRINDEMRQYAVLLEQSKRSMLGAIVATDQMKASFSQMGTGIAVNYMGAGGAELTGMQGNTVAANRTTLKDAQKNFDYYDRQVKAGKMSADSSDYLAAKSGLLSAQGGLLASESSLVRDFSPTMDVQERRQQANWGLQLSQHGFTPYINKMSLYAADARAVGDQMTQRSKAFSKQMSSYDEDVSRGLLTPTQAADAKRKARLDYNSAQMRDGGAILGDLDSYMGGADDVLANSLVGAPGRSGFISHGLFGMMAAAPVLSRVRGGMYGGRSGYGGAGGMAARDFNFDRFPAMLHSLVGTNSQAGFAASTVDMMGGINGVGAVGAGHPLAAGGDVAHMLGTALRQRGPTAWERAHTFEPGATGMLSGGGVLRPPQQQTLRIILEDKRISVEHNGQTQSIGRGGSQTVITHLLNGADAFIPRFASSTSHE